MEQSLTPAQRLIIAADFKFEAQGSHGAPAEFIRYSVLQLAQDLQKLDVTIKLNSGLRALGYRFIDDIRQTGVRRVFADLKLNDIPETVKADGLLLAPYEPEIVTIMCSCGPKSINALCEVLPDTDIAGVTVLTSLEADDVSVMHNASIRDTVLHLVEHTIKNTPVRTFVCSPAEVPMLIQEFGKDLQLITPGIRPTWTIVGEDDQNQNRIMTPTRAILAGSTKLVVGRPILQSESRYEAAKRTIEEIASVCLP